MTRILQSGKLPDRQEVHDDFGYASGALLFNLNLAPGSAQEIYVAVPFGAVLDGDTCISSLKSESGPIHVRPSPYRAGSSRRPVLLKFLCRCICVVLPVRLKPQRPIYALTAMALHCTPARGATAAHGYAMAWSWERPFCGWAARMPCGISSDGMPVFRQTTAPSPTARTAEGSEWLPEYRCLWPVYFRRHGILPVHGRQAVS